MWVLQALLHHLHFQLCVNQLDAYFKEFNVTIEVLEFEVWYFII